MLAAAVSVVSASSLLTAQDFLPWRGARVVVASFAVGAVPFSYLFARSLKGVDLRRIGTGTVSGTGLYRVGGFAALVAGGGMDVLKGFVGVLAAGDAPGVAALAAAAAVAGHNWSPFIGAAGGRGLSPAMGAMTPLAWPATALLAGSLLVGRLIRRSALAALLALLVMPFLVRWTHGGWAFTAAWLVTSLILIKRLAGNRRTPEGQPVWGTLWNRLLRDNDPTP